MVGWGTHTQGGFIHPLPPPVAYQMLCYCDGQGPPQSSTAVGILPGRFFRRRAGRHWPYITGFPTQNPNSDYFTPHTSRSTTNRPSYFISPPLWARMLIPCRYGYGMEGSLPNWGLTVINAGGPNKQPSIPRPLSCARQMSETRSGSPRPQGPGALGGWQRPPQQLWVWPLTHPPTAFS